MSAPAPVPDPTANMPAPVPSITEEPNPVAAAAAVAANAANTGIVPAPAAVTAAAAKAVVPTVTPSAAVPTAAPTTASASPAKSSSKSKKKKSQVTVTMATAQRPQVNGHGAQGENTGRWTAEEHRLFLEGLEQHGKGWKKIASLIKSRTVVQIRTHAQKYFQKLAKARQNGEEGDVSMEGRGGPAAIPPVATSAAQSNKRRRQTSGTKRKAIESVVESAQRQGKKMAAAQAASGVPNPTAPLPSVAPSLSPYVLPTQPSHPDSLGSQPPVPSAASGAISGPALEDSLFRFLTPAPVASAEPAVNEIARQAGANPITVPTEPYNSAVPPSGGALSPTGVTEFAMYPSWTDAKDTPSWYSRGSDVEALLDVADTLDWLTDTGDIHEAYQPASTADADDTDSVQDPSLEKEVGGLGHTSSMNNMSTNTLPRVDSSVDVVVPPLPSLFDGPPEAEDATKTSVHQLTTSASSGTIDEHLEVFDTPLEEHDFVSSMLETTGESTASLVALQ